MKMLQAKRALSGSIPALQRFSLLSALMPKQGESANGKERLTLLLYYLNREETKIVKKFLY